ncbi:hypothetical protein ABIF91_003032 [Bradyrhizobium sp. USDA 241]
MPAIISIQIGLWPMRRASCGPAKFTAPYRFCLSFAHPGRGAGRLRIAAELQMGVGMSGRIASPSKRTLFPALRFRAKIILGFAAVLVISAGSMAFSYFGFERVASGVGSYRSSVSEADLARNIDRELLAYRSAARYFVVTGKEDDAKAALDAEGSLKNAIDQAVKGAKTPARQESLDKLAKEFSNFSATFAKVLKAKRDSALRRPISC